jgi:hypothetical protein
MVGISKSSTPLWNSLAARIAVPALIGFVLGFVMSEGPALWIDDPTSRPTQKVELIIPAGTAERVAAGEQAPAIPDGLKLATGDTLLVRNEDVVSHQLGPMWIPAGTTGKLAFPRTVAGRYSCSFTPEGTFGIDVEQRLTGFERFVYILVAGLPFAAVLTGVSVFLWFSQKSPSTPGSNAAAQHGGAPPISPAR